MRENFTAALWKHKKRQNVEKENFCKIHEQTLASWSCCIYGSGQLASWEHQHQRALGKLEILGHKKMWNSKNKNFPFTFQYTIPLPHSNSSLVSRFSPLCPSFMLNFTFTLMLRGWNGLSYEGEKVLAEKLYIKKREFEKKKILAGPCHKITMYPHTLK